MSEVTYGPLVKKMIFTCVYAKFSHKEIQDAYIVFIAFFLVNF